MASLQGLGSDNVCLIPTDSRGKMDLNELEKSVEATLKDNAVPFLVSATAGNFLPLIFILKADVS